MKKTIELNQCLTMPTAGLAIGFYEFSASVYVVNYAGGTPVYMGATAVLFPDTTPVPLVAQGSCVGMSEDGVLRLVAIIANNGQGTIKDILK